jgi:hypothetical protein
MLETHSFFAGFPGLASDADIFGEIENLRMVPEEGVEPTRY